MSDRPRSWISRVFPPQPLRMQGYVPNGCRIGPPCSWRRGSPPRSCCNLMLNALNHAPNSQRHSEQQCTRWRDETAFVSQPHKSDHLRSPFTFGFPHSQCCGTVCSLTLTTSSSFRATPVGITANTTCCRFPNFPQCDNFPSNIRLNVLTVAPSFQRPPGPLAA